MILVMLRGNPQASELRYRGFWWGIVSAWRKAGVYIREEDGIPVVDGGGRELYEAGRIGGEECIKDLDVRRWMEVMGDSNQNGFEAWPKGWQKIQKGEEVDWRKIWKVLTELKQWVKPSMWICWWRGLRRTTMLNARTGHWMENGVWCEWCIGGDGIGEKQTVEHLLEGCGQLEEWWNTLEKGAGWTIGRRIGDWKSRLLPSGNIWQDVGRMVAWWTIVCVHW